MTGREDTRPMTVSDAYDRRPWGSYRVVAHTTDTKMKLLRVAPRSQTSLQYHEHRSEVMVVVRGCGVILVGDVVHRVEVGSIVRVPTGVQHRIVTDNSEIVLAEVQLSDAGVFEESDIVRIEDDYGRADKS